MAQFGYTLLGEQAGPRQLVADAIHAQAAGFDYAVISDHYNPWLEEQGHSPYAWAVLGAVAQATDRLGLMSFVTCPTHRYHPAVVAQKAATVSLLSQGRFTLGVGAGENLNEHITGEWPQISQRHEMLREALEIIRRLLAGERIRYEGEYFDVPQAQLWDRPAGGVPVAVAVSGPASAQIAADHGEAMIGTQPDPRLGALFDQAGGTGRPRYGQVPVCYGPDEAACRALAREQWRWGGFGWRVLSHLPDPAAFDQATQPVTEDDVAATVPCGPDVDRHVEAVRRYLDAGFTDLALVQVGGPTQDRFLDWAQRELLPALRRLPPPAGDGPVPPGHRGMAPATVARPGGPLGTVAGHAGATRASTPAGGGGQAPVPAGVGGPDPVPGMHPGPGMTPGLRDGAGFVPDSTAGDVPGVAGDATGLERGGHGNGAAT